MNEEEHDEFFKKWGSPATNSNTIMTSCEKQLFVERQMSEFWKFQNEAMRNTQEQWRSQYYNYVETKDVITSSMREFEKTFLDGLAKIVEKL
jgi:hypothetical protein